MNGSLQTGSGRAVEGDGVGRLVGFGADLAVGFGAELSIGSGLGWSVGLGVGFGAELTVKGVLVAGTKEESGPTLSLHPHVVCSWTASEQMTSTLGASQNSLGSGPSICVSEKVKESRVEANFPTSLGMVPR
jgi:hypothetical protein